jgi:hypothetical protein
MSPPAYRTRTDIARGAISPEASCFLGTFCLKHKLRSEYNLDVLILRERLALVRISESNFVYGEGES